MKNARQAKILELIERQPVNGQEELLSLLGAEGFAVTQATVSRDIREMRLIKAAAGDGTYRYRDSFQDAKTRHTPNRFEMIFRESVVKVDCAGNIVLVKCFSGMANAACELFDSMQWDGAVGTLSGDDTFIVIMRDEKAAVILCRQLEQFLSKR